MKKFYFVLFTTSFAFVLSQECFSQTGQVSSNENQSRQTSIQKTFGLVGNIVGPGFKVLPKPAQPATLPSRTWITPVTSDPSPNLFTFSTGISIGPGPSNLVTPGPVLNQTFVQNIFPNPGIFGQLVEYFGGEFMLGDLTGAIHPDVAMVGTNSVMPSLGIFSSPFSNFEIGINGQYFQSEWSGQYSIMVFPFDEGQPRVELGSISASARGFMVDAGIKYLFSGNMVRPFLEGGIMRQMVTSSTNEMLVADFSFPVDLAVMESQFSGYGGVGARVYLAEKVFLQVGSRYGSWPGSVYSFGGGASVGVSF